MRRLPYVDRSLNQSHSQAAQISRPPITDQERLARGRLSVFRGNARGATGSLWTDSLLVIILARLSRF